MWNFTILQRLLVLYFSYFFEVNRKSRKRKVAPHYRYFIFYNQGNIDISRGNLVLRHFALLFSPNIRDIAYWMAEASDMLSLSFPRVGIKSMTIAFTVTRLATVSQLPHTWQIKLGYYKTKIAIRNKSYNLFITISAKTRYSEKYYLK